MIQLKSAITTRASLPIMPSTEITNVENISIARGSAYHAYPSSFSPTKTRASPLDKPVGIRNIVSKFDFDYGVILLLP